MKQPNELTKEIDLGDNHYLRFFVWSPDFSLSENAVKWAHLAHLIRTRPVVGAIVKHRCTTETGWHEGVIHFKTDLTDVGPFQNDTKWEVHIWDPLTLSPSLLSRCPCGDHGFIRQGRWVRA